MKISFYMLILVLLLFWLVPPHFICSGDGIVSGPAPRGAFWSRAFPSENCAPSSEECAPKKLTDSVPLECSLRLETPKILIISPKIREQKAFFRRFCGEDLFFCFFGLHSRIWGNKVFVSPKKIINAFPVTLLWRQTSKFLSLFVALFGTIDADVTRGEFRWSGLLLKPD